MNLQPGILFAALLGLQAVGAANITVTSTADNGPGTLRAALLTASDGDTIDFALLTPAKITLTSGELVVSRGLSILGPGPSNLLIDGAHQWGVFVIQFPYGATNNAVTISGLTITNGYARNGSGGLSAEGAILTVSNCMLAGNRSASEGGAIRSSGQLQIISSTVKDNSAVFRGGGVFNRYGAVLITHCTFTGNSAYDGGAIYSGGELLRVANSIVSGNSAWYGGGIVNRAFNATASLILIRSSVSRNRAFPDVVGYSFGGGILNEGSDTSRANLAITDCTIERNVAPEGGGIWNSAVGGTTYVGITNSTISGNAAFCPPEYEECFGSETGGAIFNSASPNSFAYRGTGTVYVVNSTLADNTSAGNGSGIYVEGTPGAAKVVIASSIFAAGKSNGPMFRIVGWGSAISLGYNVCSDAGSGLLTDTTDRINTDARLGQLQDNGGPTFTHAPLPGSPAVDNGRNFSGSTNDQRGFARTVNIAGIPNAAGGDGTDIGAVESQDAGLCLVNFDVVSNRFGFNLIGPFNSVVVEASTSLSNWTALATNIITDEPFRFSDPSAEQSQRFYRARLYSPWDY